MLVTRSRKMISAGQVSNHPVTVLFKMHGIDARGVAMPSRFIGTLGDLAFIPQGLPSLTESDHFLVNPAEVPETISRFLVG